MTNITLRTVKGASLTYEEMDNNLSQFVVTGSVQKGEGEHLLRLHYTGSVNLDYQPRVDVLDITPFPYTGTASITGSLGVTGAVTATTFIGDGSQLTGLPTQQPGDYTGAGQFGIVPTQGVNNQITGQFGVISNGTQNIITGDFVTISGGTGNTGVGNFSVVGGGQSNTVDGVGSVIAGGRTNSVTAASGSILGGALNQVQGQLSTIGGGLQNQIQGTTSVIGGGQQNTVNVGTVGGTIGGGQQNQVQNNHSTVGGGLANNVQGEKATVAGGNGNTVSAQSGTIAGGRQNLVTGVEGSILGGQNNKVLQARSVVVGGRENEVTQADSAIVAGLRNTVTGQYSTIVGGESNTLNATYGAILSGYNNTASGTRTVIVGGSENTIPSGLTDVFILGNNLTATTSNTTYVGNLDVSETLKVGSVVNQQGDFLTIPNTGVVSRRTPSQLRSDIDAEQSFLKGNITTAINHPITITNGTERLVGSSEAVISHSTSGWTNKTSLTGATVISNLSVDTFGHISDWTTRTLTPANIGALDLTGGTLTGFLTLHANPTNALHAATKQYVDGILASNDAMIFKGTLGTGGTVTALPTTHDIGWTFKVITAGTYAGKVAEVGDMYISLVTRSGSGNVDSDWAVIQTNIDGAVTGPASAVANRIATFSGTTGKVIQDSGFTIATSVPANAVFTDTTYELATTSVSGLVRLGVAAANATVNAATTTAGRFYHVGATTVGNMYVNVPWTDTVYTHPTQTAIDTGTLSGASVISKVTVDTLGHTTLVGTRTLTLADLGYTGATDANNYIHPTYSTVSQTLTGATVLASFSSDSIGSVTGFTTRTLTPADIGAAAATHSHTVAWGAGTTAGPTLSVEGGTAVAIPVASASASGAITTGTQTIAGNKTFTAKTIIQAFSFGPSDHDLVLERNGSASGFLTGPNLLLFDTAAATQSVLEHSQGNLRILSNTGGGNTLTATFGSNGNFTVPGTVTASNFITTSDKRLKSQIKPIENALEVLTKLTSYEYLKNNEKEAGFIAQEVQEVLPYAVFEKEDGYLTMSDRPILAYLHKAVLELKNEIDIIKSKLE